MNMPLPTDFLGHLVVRAHDRLTPSEQVLARVMLEDPTAIAFGTVADLARMADVSPPTIPGFARTEAAWGITSKFFD